MDLAVPCPTSTRADRDAGPPGGIETERATDDGGREDDAGGASCTSIGAVAARAGTATKGSTALVLADQRSGNLRQLQGQRTRTRPRRMGAHGWPAAHVRRAKARGDSAPDAPLAGLRPAAGRQRAAAADQRHRKLCRNSRRLDPAAEADREFRLNVARAGPTCAEKSKPTTAASRANCRWSFALRTPSAKSSSSASISISRRCRNWTATEAALQQAAGPSGAAVQVKPRTRLGQVTTLGYDDLSGQLRSALDQFAGVKLVPFWFVALLIVLYIVCIGPLDYLFVKRVLKRMELTWVTFPAIVLLFSLGAYVLAYQLKGDQLHLNRSTWWTSTRELAGARHDLVPTSSALGSIRTTCRLLLKRRCGRTRPPQMLLSWMGLPGAGSGACPATRMRALLGPTVRFSPSSTRSRACRVSLVHQGGDGPLALRQAAKLLGGADLAALRSS